MTVQTSPNNQTMNLKVLFAGAAVVMIIALCVFTTMRSSDLESVSSSEPPPESPLIEARPGMLVSPTDAHSRIPQVPSVEQASDHSERRDAPLLQREFASLYDTKSIEELEEEYEILAAQIQEIATPAYKQRFAAGEYDVIGHGNALRRAPDERDKLVAYKMVPLEGSDKKEIRRVELPADQYLDAYEMLYEAIRLVDELDHRKTNR